MDDRYDQDETGGLSILDVAKIFCLYKFLNCVASVRLHVRRIDSVAEVGRRVVRGEYQKSLSVFLSLLSD